MVTTNSAYCYFLTERNVNERKELERRVEPNVPVSEVRADNLYSQQKHADGNKVKVNHIQWTDQCMILTYYAFHCVHKVYQYMCVVRVHAYVCTCTSARVCVARVRLLCMLLA